MVAPFFAGVVGAVCLSGACPPVLDVVMRRGLPLAWCWCVAWWGCLLFAGCGRRVAGDGVSLHSGMSIVVWLDVLAGVCGGSGGFGLTGALWDSVLAFPCGLNVCLWVWFCGVWRPSVWVWFLTFLAGGWYWWLFATCSGSVGLACCCCVGLAAVSLGVALPFSWCLGGWWCRSPQSLAEGLFGLVAVLGGSPPILSRFFGAASCSPWLRCGVGFVGSVCWWSVSVGWWLPFGFVRVSWPVGMWQIAGLGAGVWWLVGASRPAVGVTLPGGAWWWVAAWWWSSGSSVVSVTAVGLCGQLLCFWCVAVVFRDLLLA